MVIQRMRKALLASMALGLLIVGCGGAGGGSTFGGNAPLVATYSTNFTRGSVANSSLVLFIDNHGRIGAQINDATETEWAGQGSVSGTNITLSLQPVSSVTGNVLLQGTIVPGTPPTINVTLSGAFSASTTATQLAGSNVNPAAGTYSVNYTGSENGTATLTVADDGSVTGTLNSPSQGNNIPVEGTVALDGATHFTFQKFASTGSFTGYIFLPPSSVLFHGSGDWTSGSMEGTWTGAQLATP